MLPSTVAKLAAITASPIDKVGMALALAAAIDRNPSRAVEVYVVPIGERPTGNARTTGKALQEVQVTIGVVIALRAINDPDGERGTDKLQQVRDAVRNALLGFTPNGATTHFLMAASDLVRMAPGGLWWLDRYTTKTQRKQL